MSEKMTPETGWVYMVRCKNNSLYTGWTNDLPARLRAHRTGRGAKYTRAFGAVELAYAQQLPGRSEALRREAQLKKLTKAQKEELCRRWRQQGRPGAAGTEPGDKADE